MRQLERAPFHDAVQLVGRAAFPAGEFVGQQSFMTASEIGALARLAGIGPGVSVLDLCCGVAGPGRFITAEFGCTYLGVDRSARALEVAETLAGDLPCRFEQRHLPPLPDGRYDVILLLETMLAFPDKRALLQDVAAALHPGGRFAFTVEAGRALTLAERAEMPHADTVWPVEIDDLELLLSEVGLAASWRRECTASHLQAARALSRAYCAHSSALSRTIGRQALADLITSHDVWCAWMAAGRIRKYQIVAATGRADSNDMSRSSS